jgi:hypothetical protein
MGATGRSGGGAYSWWIAALDDRIKAAAPVAGITDLRNHVIDGVVEGHCDCMYISNSHRWDYANVAALVAPRPLLIANTDSDNIFPLDGVLRAFEKVRPIYKLYNAADKLGLQISAGGHKDTQELQIAAFKFFDKHLRGEERTIERAATKQFEPQELRVFDKLPADQRNTTIHETFTQRFTAPAITGKRDWDSQSTQWRQMLREKVFPYWPPEPATTSAPPRVVASQKHDDLRLTVYDVAIHEGLALPLFQVELVGRKPSKEVDLLIMNDDGWRELTSALSGRLDQPLAAYGSPDNLAASSEAAFNELARRLRERDQFFFAPRNIGPTASNPATKAQTQLRRRYMLLGESLEGMQAWDVRRAIEAIRSIGDPDNSTLQLHVRANGEISAAALYGSLDRWRQPQLSFGSPPASHRTGAPFFHALRYIDMPQAVVLAAERGHVELSNVRAEDWRYATELAAKLGWKDRLRLSANDTAAAK